MKKKKVTLDGKARVCQRTAGSSYNCLMYIIKLFLQQTVIYGEGYGGVVGVGLGGFG